MANEVDGILRQAITAVKSAPTTVSSAAENCPSPLSCYPLCVTRFLRKSQFENGETTISMGDALDLSGDGGVVKTIVRQAKPGAIAPLDDLPLVDVHYEGILAETGEVFDTTREDNTIFSFEIGKGSVIKAWDITLRTMKVGEVANITCKPEYAYGAAGSPPDIPPNATLIFEVELLACKPRKGSSLGSTQDERSRLEELKKQREMATALKEEEKKKREEAKAAAAARIQAKLESKKGKGKGKAK